VFNPLSYATCAGNIAKSVAGDAFDSIAKSFGNAAQSATQWLWAQINTATAIHLGGQGFSTVVGIVAAIAGTVAVALFVVQIIQSVLRREPGGLGRAFKGLLVAFIAGGVAVAVLNALLAATDALCNGIVQTAVGTSQAGLGQLVLGSTAAAALTGMISGPGGAAGVLLLALAILAAVVIVYLALVVRKVLIVVTAAFAPLAFAGSLADITVAWTRRWIEFTLALVFSKLVLVLIFVIGYFMLIKGVGQAGSGVTQEITQIISGVIVLALAGFAPWLALKVVHFTGEHAGQLHALGATAVGGAASAARMGQKAAPVLRTSSSTSPTALAGADSTPGASAGTSAAPTSNPAGPAPTPTGNTAAGSSPAGGSSGSPQPPGAPDGAGSSSTGGASREDPVGAGVGGSGFPTAPASRTPGPAGAPSPSPSPAATPASGRPRSAPAAPTAVPVGAAGSATSAGAAVL
jgi:hypothetical protein